MVLAVLDQSAFIEFKVGVTFEKGNLEYEQFSDEYILDNI